MANHTRQPQEEWIDPDGESRRLPESGCLSEEQIHREHSAALAATLFHDPGSRDEVVLELESGSLRLLRIGR
jgi:hypothetical protein